MKRNAVMFFALAMVAFALASMIPLGPQQATGLDSVGDTTVVVRRMYEGLRPDFWGADASPDGRYVTQTDWGTGDLSVLDLLTGESRHVTAKPNGWSDDSYSESAQFSPDGRAIAYVWYQDGDYEVRVIGTDGMNERILVPRDPARMSWHYLHDWSSDGKHLLDTFCHRGAGGGEGCDLRLINLESGTARVLFDEPKGSGSIVAGFSPDGRYVGFSMIPRDRSDGSTKGADLYLIPVDGGDAVQALSGPPNDGFLGWDPTGADILFQSDRDLTEGVWRLPVRNGRPAGDPVLVKGDLWNIQHVGVSSGRLFYGIITERKTLYTAGIDLTRGRLTSQPVRVETEPDLMVGPGAWSPDGLMLAYSRESRGKVDLIIRSVDREQAQEIQTPFRARHRGLWWGANRDRLIAHGSTASDPTWRGLVQIDRRTGEVSRYLNSEGVVRWATLTADRKTAYYAQWNGTPGTSGDAHFLIRHDLETGTIDRIARLDTLLSGLMIMRNTVLSPDEQTLAFQSFNRTTDEWTIGVISTVTGEARELARHPVQVSDPNDPNDPDVSCDLLVWKADGQSIVYARAITGQHDCTIYRVPADGGEVESLGRMPSHVAPVLTPDQSRIVFGHGELRGEIWMMDNIAGT